MNFTHLILLVFAIQLVLFMTDISEIPGTALYTFITHPYTWESDTFSGLLNDIIAGISAVTIIIGLYIYKSDFVVFAGVVGTFFSFGKPVAELFSLVNAQLGQTVAFVVVSPIVIIYFMTLIAFWRGRA